jgi:hypothetical protein
MPKRTKVLLMSLAVTGAISATLLGFDPALVGAIALAICIVILAVQLAIKFLLEPTVDSNQHDPFGDFTSTAREHTDPTIEDQGAYNPKNPALPFHLDPP